MQDRAESTAPLLSGSGKISYHRRLVTWLVLFVVVATSLSVGYHYVASAYYNHGYPYDTFLLDPAHHFSDYYLVYRDAKDFHPKESSNVVYSPLLHLLMTALLVFPATVGFVAMIAIFLAVLIAVIWRWVTAGDMDVGSRLQQTFILVALSYPVLFLLDRGNLEMVIFVLLAAFFWLYYARGSRWAWIPLALAIAGKYYWVTLLLLPLSDRNVRQAVYAVLGAVFASVVSGLVLAWTSGYTLAAVFHDTLSTLSRRGNAYGSYLSIQHAHTLWGTLQLVNRLSDYRLSGIPNLDSGYFYISVCVFLLVAYNVLVRDLAPWRKVTVLVAATLLLPFESFDYTLVHLYFPLAMLLCAARPSRGARLSLALIAVCLVPMAYYYFRLVGWQSDISISVFVYSAALIGLIVVPLITGERERSSWRSRFAWAEPLASGVLPGRRTSSGQELTPALEASPVQEALPLSGSSSE